MKNKVQIKKFLGMEVRVVNEEYIILKDMFSALGRVKADGTWTDEKKKLLDFLNDIRKSDHHESLEVVVKKGQTENVDCLRIDTVPIVLTQFKPTARKGIEALETWRKFMIFVDDLLSSLEVYKYIIVDKDKQKSSTGILSDNGGSPMIANKMTNQIMAILINVYPEIKEIKKDELKIYQSQTTIDLLDVRDFVYGKFVNAYEFTGSHSESKDMALKLAKRKYNL